MLSRVRALKREHDVAISFLSGVNLLNALAGPRHKTIVSERGSKRHDIGMTNFQRALWTRILDRLTYWRAAKVVAASEGLAHEIITANRWTADHVVAIEGAVRARGLVEAADGQIESELETLAEFETVVTFGRQHVQKGYDFLLEAFAQVREIRPRARLLMIGDGPEATRLREIGANLGLRCGKAGDDVDVIFAGMQPEPLRYVRLGRVFVLPSRYEGLPNALIEALATGMPVLASDCPWGPRSILSEGSLGYGQGEPTFPCKLAHGVLMPLPEATNALSLWVRELSRALETPQPRIDQDDRLRLTLRYDIESTGPVWLAHAKQLAAIGRGESR
jgi:glycosyltransferase involved in cell wall biosynthesis